MGGQVYNVACRGDIGYVAAGQGGLHVVQVRPEFQRLRHIPTTNRVLDVDIQNDQLYVAEGTEGLTIWRTQRAGELSFVGRYRVEEDFVRQVIVPESGKFALLMVGPSGFHIVDLKNPKNPVRVFGEKGHGLLTGDNIADGLIEHRYAGVFWHKSGNYRKPTDRIRWYDLRRAGGAGFVHETSLQKIKTADGIAIVGDQILVVGNGGYRLVDPLETRNFRSINLSALAGVSVIGKPTVHEKHLYISHRPGGEIYLLDIQDIAHPRLMDQFVTQGNPSRVVPHTNCLLIPGGYEGLLIYDLPIGSRRASRGSRMERSHARRVVGTIRPLRSARPQDRFAPGQPADGAPTHDRFASLPLTDQKTGHFAPNAGESTLSNDVEISDQVYGFEIGIERLLQPARPGIWKVLQQRRVFGDGQECAGVPVLQVLLR